jgi:hypothetical protein
MSPKRIPIKTGVGLPNENEAVQAAIVLLNRRFALNASGIRRVALRMLCVTEVSVTSSLPPTSNGQLSQ